MTERAETDAICIFLDWDSKFFSRRIGRLNCSRLDDATVAEAFQWCREERIDCLYFLADSNHAATCALAEKNGFALTDVRVTLERTLVPGDKQNPPSTEVRPGREGDLASLRGIAQGAHRDTRFYSDPHFDRALCDRLYQTWIENSFHGFAQAVLVAEVDNKAVGYLTIHSKSQESQIGLLGIDPGYQGRGLGANLIRGFLAWSLAQRANRSTVVTQGKNVAAQRFYQRNGFVIASLQLWYHRWFTP
jgi:dTDP-4-amino-4,6-dideoxy-D-galactose acyltransferase